jgi:hypothetical protein
MVVVGLHSRVELLLTVVIGVVVVIIGSVMAGTIGIGVGGAMIGVVDVNWNIGALGANNIGDVSLSFLHTNQ